MREILFRGKSLRTEKWIQGYLFFCWERAYIAWGMVNDNADMKEVDPETICQYTGLTDKNGRKIFEGDICEFSVFDYNGSDTQYKGVVVYTGSRFMLWKSEKSEYYGSDGGFDLDWVVGQDDEFEIIGNIFDNPELIGEQP